MGVCPSRLKGRERRAAARPALDIGDTTEEAVSFNETTPEPVEETENAENTENTEKSVNVIRAAEISIYTSTDEADEATNLEDTASDKENSDAEKVAIVAKGETAKSEATKASNIDTSFKRFKSVHCNYTSSFEPVGRGHQGPRRGPSPIRLRRRERRAEARPANDTGDTTE